jgi:hypothetical protein
MKPIRGDVRADGKRYDGYTWRDVGVSHHMNDKGLVYYKNQYRTLEGYLQQGGSIDRVVFRNAKINNIHKLVEALYEKEEAGDVYAVWNPNFYDWIKVGKAVDAYHRCEGYQTSSPFRDYSVVAVVYSDNRAKKEKEMHKIFEHFAEERRGEWFRIDKIKAIKLFNYQVQCADKVNHDNELQHTAMCTESNA